MFPPIFNNAAQKNSGCAESQFLLQLRNALCLQALLQLRRGILAAVLPCRCAAWREHGMWCGCRLL